MFSVIICSVDDRKFAAAETHYRAHFANTDHEIIRIADAKSMCEGYNRGVAQSRGDVLIFSHDDVEFLCTGFVGVLEERLKHFDMLGVAGSTRANGPRWVQAGAPYWAGQVAHVDPQGGGYIVLIWSVGNRVIGDIATMDGLWLCAKRSLVEQIGFDEKTFTSFHLYDLDFTFRAYRAGFKLAVCADLYPLHASFGGFSGPEWQRAADAFMQKHRPALSTTPTRECMCSWARAASKAEVIEIMTPPWWPASGGG